MLVDPTRLLDDCERAWREAGEPLADGVEKAIVVRTTLVLEALVAYRLFADHSDLAPDTVFARWPACVVHAVALGDQGDGPDLAGLMAEARARVVAARPDLGSRRGAPAASEAVGDWVRTAREAARSLGWAWRPSAAADTAPQAATAVPELRLGPGGGSVLLTLPSEPNAGDWQLAADGEAFAVHPPHWVLPGPVRRVETTDPTGTTHVSAVVDPDTALLAFAADGHSIAPEEPLPAAETYLLHAGTLQFEGMRPAAVELPTPYGWSGWTLSRISLVGVTRLRTSEGAPGRWLDVAVGRSLGWEGGAILPWITGDDGAPLWQRPPALRLPLRPGEPSARHWQIEVLRPGHQEPLARSTGAPGTIVDPWREAPRPLLGPYEILVHRPGPRGRRRLTAFLAEGVDAEPSAEWRLLAPYGGLVPARLTLRAGGAVTASERVVTFAPYEIAKGLVLRGETQRFAVQACIPHSEVRLELDGRPLPWSVRPLDIDVADLAGEESALTVRLPEQAIAVTPELALVVEGTTLHTLRPDRRTRTRKGDLRYSLAALADTMRDCAKAEIRLLVAGENVHVGTVRTQPIAEEVVPDGSGLLLRGLRHPGQLTARLHAVFAPWERPLTVAVDTSGRIPLPSTWRSAGPLIVGLRAGAPAPAAAAGWPRLRDRDTLVMRRSPWTPTVINGTGARVTEYLAGHGALPSGADAIPHQWIVAARGRDLQACGARETAPTECLSALGDAGPAALTGSADSFLRSGELAAVLVSSGLAALRIREVAEPEAVRHVWRRAPLCALLLTAPLLPYLADHPDYDMGELYPEEVELLDEVGQFLGDGGPALLAGQADPSSTAGRFDAQARALDHLPEIQQQAMWRNARVVPRGLLDADTRADAAWQAFRARRDLQYRAEGEECRDWLDAVTMFLDDGHPSLAQALRHRNPGALHGPGEAWMRVPQLSLGCALIARLAAAGDARAAKLERGLRPLWASVASHAPDLTAVDLALAECLVTAEAVHGAS
ncbi:hypothetical protein ACGFY0_28810 [Streptomyces chartreusis]|uniref:hypothetical protein n=1 Tax=Streptomyces chartreusis TaxID=1969 RepID=UPI0037103DB4